MAPHSSTLAWKIPWAEEADRLQSIGLLRVEHDLATSLSLFTFIHWRRKWQPTPVSLPGESRDGGVWWAVVYRVAQRQTQLKRLSSSGLYKYMAASRTGWGTEHSVFLRGESKLEFYDILWHCCSQNSSRSRYSPWGGGSALSPQCFGQYLTQVSVQDMPVEINLMHGFATHCRLHMEVHGFLRVNNCIHLIRHKHSVLVDL